MSIDEIMALADEYVSASIEDHGYRSGAASAEYLEDTKRKLLAALESLIAAPAAPQQVEPVAWMKPTRDSCYLRSAETMLAIHEDFDGIARTGWTPLYLHPPPAEVQRLRAALECIEKCTTDQLNRVIARRALEGK